MRRTILYYPNIEIPDGDWIRKSLLYWDEVSSIVPRGIEHELYTNSYITAQLHDEGEYRAIFPDQLKTNEIYDDFEREINNKIRMIGKSHFLHSPKLQKRLIHNDKLIIKNNRHREVLFDTVPIHREKIPNEIIDRLYYLNRGPSNDEWVSIDSQIANIYMATLAKYTALADSNKTVIGTDQPNSINDIYSLRYASKPSKYKTPTLNMSLNILPTPSKDVPIKNIIAFKRKYRLELLSLREQISKFEIDISNSESHEELKEKSLVFKEKIEKETRDTIKMLKSDKIDFFLSSLRTIVNIKSPTLMGTCAAIAGNKLINFPLVASLTGIGIVGALDITTKYVAMNRATKKNLSDKGFLYLYHANNQSIIKDFV